MNGRAMKLFVDDMRCQGHGRCYATAPDLLHPNDEDWHAELTQSDISAGDVRLLQQARRAVADCPERAISLQEATL